MNEQLVSSSVVSSRIRLARNVAGYPFPKKFDSLVSLSYPEKEKDEAEARALAEKVFTGLKPLKEDLSLLYIPDIPVEMQEAYRENYVISQTLIRHFNFASLITNPNGSISIMINEEDHIREQYMGRGFCVRNLFERAMDIDENYIGKAVRYAVSDQFGFLTACPSNLGTGLRASVMMFLPASTRKRELFDRIKAKLAAEGFIFRGVNGEGSRADGYLYQISNEVTLGVKGKDIVETLEDFVYYLCELEAKERVLWKEQDIYALKDRCGRAYGILSNAELLSYPEFSKLMSELKLGIALGFYGTDDIQRVNDLVVAMRPTNLAMWVRKDPLPIELDDEDIMAEEADLDVSCDEVTNKDIYRAQCVRQFVERYISKE